MSKESPREPVGTWYRASWSWTPEVSPHSIVTHSDKTVTYLESTKWDGSGPLRERREEKSSRDYQWFKTWTEARDAVVDRFKKRYDHAEKQLNEAIALKQDSE